jgi:geranylgeranyl diphosphate synthase type I
MIYRSLTNSGVSEVQPHFIQTGRWRKLLFRHKREDRSTTIRTEKSMQQPADTTSEEVHAAELPAFFARYQELIDLALKAELDGLSLPLYETHSYYMGWSDVDGSASSSSGGKRLRPTLALLAAEAAGGQPERALPVAVSLEYVHNFSLIHDDLEDQDRIRHHRPTVWAVWGEATAIVSGNAMLKIADRALERLSDHGIGSDVVLETQHALAANYLRMMEGQYLDIQFESFASVTVEQYLDMIERKTGALIETAVFLGSLVGRPDGPDARFSEGLRSVGYELGRIFQIRDDILGVWGGQETGKPVGADIERKKKALPAVHALSTASGPAKKRFADIFAKDQIDGRDIEDALEIMEDLRTQEYCQSLADDRWRRARSVIQSLELVGETTRDLEDLGEFLLVRTS